MNGMQTVTLDWSDQADLVCKPSYRPQLAPCCYLQLSRSHSVLLVLPRDVSLRGLCIGGLEAALKLQSKAAALAERLSAEPTALAQAADLMIAAASDGSLSLSQPGNESEGNSDVQFPSVVGAVAVSSTIIVLVISIKWWSRTTTH